MSEACDVIRCQKLAPSLRPIQVSDLGTLPGGTNSDVGGIKALGWVVGHSETGDIDPFINAPAERATLCKRNQPVDLGTLGGYISNAFHVDDGG